MGLRPAYPVYHWQHSAVRVQCGVDRAQQAASWLTVSQHFNGLVFSPCKLFQIRSLVFFIQQKESVRYLLGSKNTLRA